MTDPDPGAPARHLPVLVAQVLLADQAQADPAWLRVALADQARRLGRERRPEHWLGLPWPPRQLARLPRTNRSRFLLLKLFRRLSFELFSNAP